MMEEIGTVHVKHAVALPIPERHTTKVKANRRARLFDLQALEKRQLLSLTIDVRVAVKKHLLPDAVDDNGLLEAVVTAEAIGRPNLIVSA